MELFHCPYFSIVISILVIKYTSISGKEHYDIESTFMQLILQDHNRTEELTSIGSSGNKNIYEIKDLFYQSINKPLQTDCKILKKFGGQWNPYCGFFDGEKMICMDLIYEAIQNGSCLIYSFGLADNWDFEIAMAELGCIVKAFDPSGAVKRPSNSYHASLFYYDVGIDFYDHHKIFLKYQYTEFYKTLKTLLQENEDFGKTITYLKMDVEGTELYCFQNWFETDVFKYIQQFGVELHISNDIEKHNLKRWYVKLEKNLGQLFMKYNFSLVDNEPNRCMGKQEDNQKTYYTYNDLLFIKK